MRTTLDIDDDILFAAKDIARDRKTSAGQVLSEWARKGLTQMPQFEELNGFPVWPARPGAGFATLELVNRLRDEDP